jgi:hypothetical protein
MRKAGTAQADGWREFGNRLLCVACILTSGAIGAWMASFGLEVMATSDIIPMGFALVLGGASAGLGGVLAILGVSHRVTEPWNAQSRMARFPWEWLLTALILLNLSLLMGMLTFFSQKKNPGGYVFDPASGLVLLCSLSLFIAAVMKIRFILRRDALEDKL